jgi:glycerol-3-phosphate acyltransferase PlsX
MGTVFAHHRFSIDEPKVGLLSIGEESSKGNTLVKETHERLVSAPGVRFVGNVEGRDIMTSAVDVVVTDGFTGNVVLKTLEGGVKAIVKALLGAFASAPEYKEPADALLPALLPLYETLDPDTYGGAMLLGVDGVCIISHGSSGARAMVNAIRVGREMVDAGLVGELRAAVSRE